MSPQNRERVWFPSGTSAMTEERDIRGIILWFSDKKEREKRLAIIMVDAIEKNRSDSFEWKKWNLKTWRRKFFSIERKIKSNPWWMVNEKEIARESGWKVIEDGWNSLDIRCLSNSILLYPLSSPPLLLPSFNFPVTGNKRSPDN